MERTTAQDQLEGMPEPYRYWRTVHDGEVLVGFGERVLLCFDEHDRGMRNLAVVALTEAGVSGKEVAALFGLTPVYVSRLRTRAADGGSRALVAPRGAPRKLSGARERRAVALSKAGVSGAEIARRMGVSEATVSRLLARGRASVVVQGAFELDLAGEAPAGGEHVEEDGERAADGGEIGEGSTATVLEALADAAEEPVAAEHPGDRGPLARLGAVEVDSRYAGAMLLYAFLDRLGAERVLASLPAAQARRYDATALVLASSFSFALGSSSLKAGQASPPAGRGRAVGAGAPPVGADAAPCPGGAGAGV